MIHQLKIDSKYFEDIASGEKTFEVRNNDRNFMVGDFLALNEITEEILPFDDETKDETKKVATGRCCIVRVNYILNDPAYCKEGYVVIGIKPCKIIGLSVGCKADVYDSVQSNEDRKKVQYDRE